MRSYGVVWVMALFTGCGDEGDGQGPGSASITGTIRQQMLQPTTAFYTTQPVLGIDVLVMPEAGEACVMDGNSTGQTTLIFFPCGPVTATSYPIVDPDTACGATPHAAILVEGLEGDPTELFATAGTVTITSAGPSIVGSLAATMDGVSVTGTFDAIDCP
jgi:hypothetical protein